MSVGSICFLEQQKLKHSRNTSLTFLCTGPSPRACSRLQDSLQQLALSEACDGEDQGSDCRLCMKLFLPWMCTPTCPFPLCTPACCSLTGSVFISPSLRLPTSFHLPHLACSPTVPGHQPPALTVSPVNQLQGWDFSSLS